MSNLWVIYMGRRHLNSVAALQACLTPGHLTALGHWGGSRQLRSDTLVLITDNPSLTCLYCCGVGFADKAVASICHGSVPTGWLQGQGWELRWDPHECPLSQDPRPCPAQQTIPAALWPSSKLPCLPPFSPSLFSFQWLFILEFCLCESSSGLGRCCFETGSSYADEEINVLKKPEVKACTERHIQYQQ